MPGDIPEHGRDAAAVQADLTAAAARNPQLSRTLMSIGVNWGSDAVQDVLHDAYNLFSHDNNLVAFLRPGSQQLEQEVLEMAAGLLSGGQAGVVTTVTTGGTESIFNAIHAARERARKERPEVRSPNIVAPYCAHAALDKGAHYLGLEVRRVPVGADFRVAAAALEAAVDDDTIMLYASAPCWPHGLFDPIETIADIALRRDLWFHVDACVGGFLNPFMQRAGDPVPPWDFSVPGVTTISADLHKYAYALKPASVTAWRSDELLAHHYVVVDNWPAPPYAAAGFVGSRSGGPMAAAWAVMQHLGKSGYTEHARRIIATRDRIRDGLRALPDIYVPFEPESAILCFGTETLDPLKVLGGLIDRGWIHFGIIDPPLVQLVIDPSAEPYVDAYLHDLTEVVEEVAAGGGDSTAALQYVAQSLPGMPGPAQG